MGKLIIKERPFRLADKVFDLGYGKEGIVAELGGRRFKVALQGIPDLKVFYPDGTYNDSSRRTLFHLDVAEAHGFVDMEVIVEEPKPTWTPEVGMLIQFEPYGVWEITGILTGGARLERVSDRLTGSFPNRELVKHRPIAELEGLEVGESVYAISRSGDVDKHQTCGYYDKTFWVENCDAGFPVNEDGVPLYFGNGKQMFWRTKDRAERFGK